jgi:hypothetical protein
MNSKMTKEDWKKLENLSDKEIEAACEGDPDDYLPTTEELTGGWVRHPGQVDLFFPIEKEIADWFQKNNQNYIPIVQKALRQAMNASQPNNQM